MIAPPITIPDGWTREELIACAERESKLRQSAYPKWVELGRMTAKKSSHEQGAMRAIVAVLRQLPATPAPQPSLFDPRGTK